jgi:hypothetical protein
LLDLEIKAAFEFTVSGYSINLLNFKRLNSFGKLDENG